MRLERRGNAGDTVVCLFLRSTMSARSPLEAGSERCSLLPKAKLFVADAPRYADSPGEHGHLRLDPQPRGDVREEPHGRRVETAHESLGRDEGCVGCCWCHHDARSFASVARAPRLSGAHFRASHCCVCGHSWRYEGITTRIDLGHCVSKPPPFREKGDVDEGAGCAVRNDSPARRPCDIVGGWGAGSPKNLITASPKVLMRARSRLVVALLSSWFSAVSAGCTLEGQPSSSHSRGLQASKRDDAPQGENESESPAAEPLNDEPKSPRVKMDASWPAFGAKTQKQAKAIAEAIVRYLPKAGMSDSEKGRLMDKYRNSLKKAHSVILPFRLPVEVIEETPELFKVKLLEGDDAGAEYWTPRKSIEGYLPKVPEGVVATVRVELARLKPNGKAWDTRNGAPDIAVCTELSDGVHCFPGDVNPDEGLAGRACDDAYACEISGVRIPHDPFRIVVVDVDISEHDLAAEGLCWTGKACDLDVATVLAQEQ